MFNELVKCDPEGLLEGVREAVEGMLGVLSRPASHYCTACWTGRYPVPIPEGMTKKACGEALPVVEG